MPPIIFTDDDFHGLDHQQDDPMVITVEIEIYAVKKVLVDQGSSVDILYWTTYQKLQLPDTDMVPYDEPIYGFSGEQVSTHGYIDLHTVFREGTQTKIIPIRFLIVDAPTSYNGLNKIGTKLNKNNKYRCTTPRRLSLTIIVKSAYITPKDANDHYIC